MFDLRDFTLRDVTLLGSLLRRMGDGAATLEEVAQRATRYLHQNLMDGPDGKRCCALARFFKTHAYEDLDPDLQRFARALLAEARASPRMKCLTLLASAGDRPEWNSRHDSVAHRAIPLASEDLVARAPMISSLLRQLGVEVGALLEDNGLLVEPGATSFNIFYVPDARGSPFIPAQRDFVETAGIESVLGFGGMLPQGDIFAVILFLTASIPRRTAELFRTLALNLTLASLPFDEAVFGGLEEARRVARPDRFDAELRRLKARIGTLSQLLQVYEGSVVEQSERLYEVARMKSEFISALSHELRTPLTSIRGSLDLIVNGVTGELPAEAMDLCKVAQANCGRVGRLVDDVLDIEKIESGRMEFRIEPVAIGPLVERAVELMRSYGEQLRVRFEIEGALPGIRARIDPDRVIQVLENLLSNAAKFSPQEGAVRIALGHGSGWVRIDVADRGPGIPVEFQPRVFEKFAQGPVQGSRRRGGTGLGLHIARAIVERLGGRLGFTSEPGAGTTFHLELPEWRPRVVEDGP